LGFVLHDDRARRHSVAMSHVLHFQLHQVTAAQFAVDGQVKHRDVSDSLGQLQANAD
jgi:hypothetical protein